MNGTSSCCCFCCCCFQQHLAFSLFNSGYSLKAINMCTTSTDMQAFRLEIQTQLLQHTASNTLVHPVLFSSLLVFLKLGLLFPRSIHVAKESFTGKLPQRWGKCRVHFKTDIHHIGYKTQMHYFTFPNTVWFVPLSHQLCLFSAAIL